MPRDHRIADHPFPNAASVRGGAPAPFDDTIRPTTAELAQAVDRYNRDARRLRLWGWWSIGMFTLWTTLAAILLLRMFGLV
jgi:hypothetical protein